MKFIKVTQVSMELAQPGQPPIENPQVQEFDTFLKTDEILFFHKSPEINGVDLDLVGFCLKNGMRLMVSESLDEVKEILGIK